MRAVRWILMILFSGFFLLAGISKVLDAAEFSHSIAAYRIVGPLPSWLFALWIPWLEVVTAAALWLPRWRLPAALILAGLLLSFQVALLSAGVRGLDISCGCLGNTFDTGILVAFLRNLVLLAIVPLFPDLKKASQ